MNSEAL